MDETNLNSSREYKPLSITGAALVRSRKYVSKPEGWVKEQIDFPEVANVLGYRFDPRCIFTIWSPKGLIRGGHLEGRARSATVMRGTIFMVMVDMRLGDDQGKMESFYLGNAKEAWGDSVIVPEGVILAYTSVSEDSICLFVSNRPYNKFDSLLTLDAFDQDLKIPWPEGTQKQSADEETEIVGLKKFIEKI